MLLFLLGAAVVWLLIIREAPASAPRAPTIAVPKADEAGPRVRIRTNSGAYHVGRLIEDGWTEIRIDSSGNTIAIKKSAIESIAYDK